MCIKRCIGVAGDTITIDKNHIYINDTLKYVYNDDVANKRKIIVPQENDSLYIDSLNYDIYKFAIKFVENNNFQLKMYCEKVVIFLLCCACRCRRADRRG